MGYAIEMTNPSPLWKDFLANGRLTAFGIIDLHTHMGASYGVSIPDGGADGMIRVMDAENIECVACAPHSALYDPSAMNAELEAAMAKYPGRILGYYTYNPNYRERFAARLGDALKPGYVGIKLLPHYHSYALDGDAYRDALEFADEHELLVLSHTWGGSPLNGPEQAANVLARYHRLRLILGHSMPGEAEKAIALAVKYPNAYLDLCDIHRHSGMVERMVREAGADKVLFGTDMPWYDPNYCLGGVLCADISDDDRYRIIRGNAERLLGSKRKVR